MIYIVKTEKHYKYLDEPYATFETIELDSALRIIDRFVIVTALYVDDVLIEDVTDVETGAFITQTIPDDMYFVLGDNRVNSEDSRIIGFIKKEDIRGKVIYRLYPISSFGKIE